MASAWYYSVNGNKKGPVASTHLKQLAENGRINPNDLVWRIGLECWVPARKVKGLFPTPSMFDTEEAIHIRHPFTVGEFHSITNGFPNRDVALKYSEGTSVDRQLGRIDQSDVTVVLLLGIVPNRGSVSPCIECSAGV